MSLASNALAEIEQRPSANPIEEKLRTIRDQVDQFDEN